MGGLPSLGASGVGGGLAVESDLSCDDESVVNFPCVFHFWFLAAHLCRKGFRQTCKSEAIGPRTNLDLDLDLATAHGIVPR